VRIGFSSVRVAYDGCPAVVGFDAAATSGEWLCIIGPNGAGKSSLLKSIVGIVAHEGSIDVDGKVLGAMSPRERAKSVAYVPQAPVLPDDMTVTDYVLLGRNPYVSTFGRETGHDHAIVAETLADLDLSMYARRRLSTLSGGERQRLVIARALAQQAPVLLLDEPTSALDIGHQQQALELVDRLRRERGLIVISAMHDLTLAGVYAHRLMLMHQGVVVSSGTAREVLRSETLAEFYGVSVHVQHHDDGTVIVVPRRTSLH
jgi:iron complex transport system ATP-binding protein